MGSIDPLLDLHRPTVHETIEFRDGRNFQQSVFENIDTLLREGSNPTIINVVVNIDAKAYLGSGFGKKERLDSYHDRIYHSSLVNALAKSGRK